MKIMSPDTLYRYNYSVLPINSLKQYWRVGKSFSCIGTPKAYNIFVFLDGCNATYTDANGNTERADAGSLIYAPEGAEYSAVFDHFENEASGTIGINFRLFDETGTPIILDEKLRVFRGSALRGLIEKIDNADKGTPPCFATMKSGIYDIISTLGSTKNTLDEKYKIIYKGIEYLEGGSLAMSIEALAEECNVSASYFRRLFKEYCGITPMQYRMNTKISKAKDYLRHTALNSSEIADLLLFHDTAFFCRYFKAATGMTPEQFRRANK